MRGVAQPETGRATARTVACSDTDRLPSEDSVAGHRAVCNARLSAGLRTRDMTRTRRSHRLPVAASRAYRPVPWPPSFPIPLRGSAGFPPASRF